jgi:hypothetical protein
VAFALFAKAEAMIPEKPTLQATDPAQNETPAVKEPELPKPPKRRGSLDAAPGPYSNPKIEQFQKFVCNTPPERERLSNTIDLWDSMPRYSISRQEMNKRRDEKGNLPPLRLEFQYRGQAYCLIVYPAAILEGENFVDYYPGANEELAEDALRKIAARQQQGFHDEAAARSGLAFSLYELRQELAGQGHTRSYQQITQSLAILRKSHIELRRAEAKNDVLVAANYLPGMAAVSRNQLDEDPDARWVAQFHPLVSRSIDQLTYRQFNYATMMGLPTQLGRWLHKQLSIKFNFASLFGNPFEMHYSTIKRDSNLLNCGRERDNRNSVDSAFAELLNNGVLREVQKRTVIEGKNKVADVVYLLYPSADFVREAKAANTR